eukprot:3881771-Lingulodinium_polyedra.AAC.1
MIGLCSPARQRKSSNVEWREGGRCSATDLGQAGKACRRQTKGRKASMQSAYESWARPAKAVDLLDVDWTCPHLVGLQNGVCA